MSEGTKHDEGKPDLSLVHYTAIEQEAYAMMHGQRKYGRYNYLQGFKVCRLLAAALRHIFQYLYVGTYDSDSKLNHLAHARACLGMVLGLEAEGKLIDDRYKRVAEEGTGDSGPGTSGQGGWEAGFVPSGE